MNMAPGSVFNNKLDTERVLTLIIAPKVMSVYLLLHPENHSGICNASFFLHMTSMFKTHKEDTSLL